MTYFLLFLFGIGVGLLGGLFGLSGGIALVPGLVILFGFSQQEAQGTSLAVMIPPIGLFAAIVYYQHGYVRLPIVGWVAFGFVLGAYLGASIVPYISATILRLAFGLLLLYVGFNFVISPATARPFAVLPSGFATFIAAFLGGILRRNAQRAGKPWPAPSDDIEYHI